MQIFNILNLPKLPIYSKKNLFRPIVAIPIFETPWLNPIFHPPSNLVLLLVITAIVIPAPTSTTTPPSSLLVSLISLFDNTSTAPLPVSSTVAIRCCKCNIEGQFTPWKSRTPLLEVLLFSQKSLECPFVLMEVSYAILQSEMPLVQHVLYPCHRVSPWSKICNRITKTTLKSTSPNT